MAAHTINGPYIEPRAKCADEPRCKSGYYILIQQYKKPLYHKIKVNECSSVISVHWERLFWLSAAGFQRFSLSLQKSATVQNLWLRGHENSKPIENIFIPRGFLRDDFIHSNLLSYLPLSDKAPQSISGEEMQHSLFTDGHVLRHKVTVFHVQHSTYSKYNKPCWRMAADTWLRADCCFSPCISFSLYLTWQGFSLHLENSAYVWRWDLIGRNVFYHFSTVDLGTKISMRSRWSSKTTMNVAIDIMHTYIIWPMGT